MHISDGVLSIPVSAGGWVLTGAAIGVSLKNATAKKIMETSLVVAAFFVASLIHVPIGVSNAHLTLNGLIGILLGPIAFPAIFTALLLQLVFFQYGGLLSLGVNTFNMAAPALIVWVLFRKSVREDGKRSSIAAFSSGFIALSLASCFLSASLCLSREGFWSGALLILSANIPIALAEGFITMTIISFIKKVEPSMLHMDGMVNMNGDRL